MIGFDIIHNFPSRIFDDFFLEIFSVSPKIFLIFLARRFFKIFTFFL